MCLPAFAESIPTRYINFFLYFDEAHSKNVALTVSYKDSNDKLTWTTVNFTDNVNIDSATEKKAKKLKDIVFGDNTHEQNRLIVKKLQEKLKIYPDGAWGKGTWGEFIKFCVAETKNNSYESIKLNPDIDEIIIIQIYNVATGLKKWKRNKEAQNIVLMYEYKKSLDHVKKNRAELLQNLKSFNKSYTDLKGALLSSYVKKVKALNPTKPKKTVARKKPEINNTKNISSTSNPAGNSNKHKSVSGDKSQPQESQTIKLIILGIILVLIMGGFASFYMELRRTNKNNQAIWNRLNSIKNTSNTQSFSKGGSGSLNFNAIETINVLKGQVKDVESHVSGVAGNLNKLNKGISDLEEWGKKLETKVDDNGNTLTDSILFLEAGFIDSKKKMEKEITEKFEKYNKAQKNENSKLRAEFNAKLSDIQISPSASHGGDGETENRDVLNNIHDKLNYLTKQIDNVKSAT